MEQIQSKDVLKSGDAFQKTESHTSSAKSSGGTNRGVKYDLVGKLVEEARNPEKHSAWTSLYSLRKA